jgi:hypothetical protein
VGSGLVNHHEKGAPSDNDQKAQAVIAVSILFVHGLMVVSGALKVDSKMITAI